MKTKLNFKEKIIYVLLCIALIMPYIPITVFAADETPMYVGGVNLAGGGTTYSSNGGYAKWDANNQILTLNNYQYERTRFSL